MVGAADLHQGFAAHLDTVAPVAVIVQGDDEVELAFRLALERVLAAGVADNPAVIDAVGAKVSALGASFPVYGR